MKISKSSLLVIFISVLFLSFKVKTSETDGYSTIIGTFDIPGITEVTLSKVEHGTQFVVGTSILNENKEFGFAVKSAKEGFYMLGNKYMELPLYIKGNQIFKIKYDVEGYDLLSSPDKENDILYDFYKTTDTLEVFKYYKKPPTTYKQFFPFYEQFIPKIKEQHGEVTTKNERFNELMNAYMDLKIQDVAFDFLYTPRAQHPKKDDFPSFYTDFMNDNTVKSELILDLPRGLRTLVHYQSFKYANTGADRSTKDFITEMFSGIDSSLLKGYLTLEFIKRYKTYNQSYLDFIEPLRNDIALSKYVSDEVEKYELKIKTMEPGVQGYPFTYKDINGKEVSFSDFKGKVVYIDIWATWCAPCKKEIPYLKQLKEDMQGKDVQIVGISVDKPKHYEKWKTYVENNELIGVQLFSDNAFDTKIAKDYKINAIPRFLLFDKEGKIVDANAKRPSDPRLKEQLLDLLQQ